MVTALEDRPDRAREEPAVRSGACHVELSGSEGVARERHGVGLEVVDRERVGALEPVKTLGAPLAVCRERQRRVARAEVVAQRGELVANGVRVVELTVEHERVPTGHARGEADLPHLALGGADGEHGRADTCDGGGRCGDGWWHRARRSTSASSDVTPR